MPQLIIAVLVLWGFYSFRVAIFSFFAILAWYLFIGLIVIVLLIIVLKIFEHKRNAKKEIEETARNEAAATAARSRRMAYDEDIGKIKFRAINFMSDFAMRNNINALSSEDSASTYVKNHLQIPDYSDHSLNMVSNESLFYDDLNKIARHMVWCGMSSDQIIISIGTPDIKKKIPLKKSDRVIWNYKKSKNFDKLKITTNDDIVDEILYDGEFLESLTLGANFSKKNTGTSPEEKEATRTSSCNEVLGISEHAGIDEIRAAYRKLISLYHPDKVAALGSEFNDIAERKTKEINLAYKEILKARGLSI